MGWPFEGEFWVVNGVFWDALRILSVEDICGLILLCFFVKLKRKNKFHILLFDDFTVFHDSAAIIFIYGGKHWKEA